MRDEQEIACSLSGPELAERVQEWAEVASQARTRHVEAGRIVSVYPREPRLLDRLQTLIAAEAECCPFLHFDIQQKENETIVELRVPEDMTEALAVLLGFVAAASVPESA